MSQRRTTWLVLAAMTCFFGRGYCQEPSSKPVTAHWEDGPSKFDNGLQIRWRGTAQPGAPDASEYDPEAKVEIFDGADGASVVCHVASAVRTSDSTSSGISIYDVSARKPGFIVVAAVYSRTNGAPVALLLFFTWSGSLSRRVVLDKLPPIESLEIDNRGHVWTLNNLEGGTAKAVFSEFSSSGSLIKQMVKARSVWSTDESVSQGGQVSFGLSSGRAWAWLPQSRTLVSVDKSSGKSLIAPTGLPRAEDGFMYAGKAELVPDGRLLMEVHWRGGMGWFMWSARTGWGKVAGHPGDYLYAANGDEVIFVHAGSPMAFHSDHVSTLVAAPTDR